MLNRSQLPHLPYAHPRGAVLHTWGFHHWYTSMYEIGAQSGPANFTFSRGGTQGAEGSESADLRRQPLARRSG